ncbi:toll-like receptor 12 [Clarias gariepinus]
METNDLAMCWLLFVLLLSPGTCWMSDKCLVYEDANMVENVQYGYCPTGNLTASCSDVQDVKSDLATLPRQIDSLCLEAGRGLVLRPNALERFSMLEQVYISNCPEAIHPGAFAGLTNLRSISFAEYEHLFDSKFKCCSSSVFPNAFEQLPNLTKLFFHNYNMSTVSADAFNGLKDLKFLQFSSCGTEILDISCRIAKVSKSLTSLYVSADDLVILSHRKCPRLENASIAEHFKSLKRLDFVFPNLKFLDEHVFQFFPEISFLSMPMNPVLKLQLLQSGVRKIKSLEADLRQGGLGLVCDIVSNFSVENLHLKSETYLEDIGVEGCHGLRKTNLVSSSVQDDLCFVRFLKNLQVLELEGDFLGRLLENLCELSDPVTLLQKFSLNKSKLNKITMRQFYCLKNLSTLDLSYNKISVIEDFTFKAIDKLSEQSLLYLTDNRTFNNLRSLEYLDLSRNKMSSINFATFDGLDSLKVLNLHGNKITQITVNSLIAPSGLASLESLDLSKNIIAHISDFAFKQMKTLKILILDKNAISKISRFSFFGLDRLESLTLEHNVVKYFEPSALTSLTSLRKFSVGCLKHPSSETAQAEIDLGLLFGRIPVNLTELSISSCSRPMSIVIGSESALKTGLHLHIYGKSVRLLDCKKPFFLSIVNLTAVVDQLLCGPHFAGKYFKSLESFTLSPQVMSSFIDLVDLNTLLRLQKLDFVNVDLTDQPHLGIMLHNLTMLKVLNFYQSRIPLFNEDFTKDLKSLEFLFVNVDNDLSLVENFARPLLNLRYVFLISLMLHCSCDNAWISEWAKHQRQVQVVTWMSTGGIACRNIKGIQNFAKYTESSCSSHVEFVLFATTSLWILLFMLVVLVHKLAGDYLLAFIYIARGWVDAALRKNPNRRYQYDVFVSYSGTDERWVVNELLPNLERRGPPFLRLCLHSRDFHLGTDIVENITGSLYRSRYTLCLLSRHYLRSKWCSLEMKLATDRLLVENRDVLIVVFLEKISPKKLSVHHRLARVVKRKTYIDWPEDPEKQTAFWNRLWAKLAPKPA